MSTLDQTLDSASGTSFTLSAEILQSLSTTASWAKFLGICGIVASVLMAILSLFVMSMFDMIFSQMQMPMAMPFGGGVIGILYLVIALIYFLPSLYLVQFANKTKAAIRVGNQQNLEEGLGKLKSSFAFVGVLTIIVLAFYVLGFIFAILGGAIASFV